MEPTTDTHATWKHWVAALALLIFAVVVAPLIASLPIAIAYAIAMLVAATLIGVTLALGRARR